MVENEKSLTDRAAINMHFLIGLPIRLDIKHHRRESAGYRGRREQDMTNDIKRAWIPARGNRTDVPQHRLPRVEIGRLNDEQPPFLVLGRDLHEHIAVDIAGNGL